MRMFVMGGDDVDGPRFPSSITCYLSSPPATKSVTSATAVPALGKHTRTIKAWRLWVHCMCAGCNGGLNGGKFSTSGGGREGIQICFLNVRDLKENLLESIFLI